MEADYFAFQKLVVFGCAKSGKTALTKALDSSVYDPKYKPTKKVIKPTKISCSVKGTINKPIGLNILETRLTDSPVSEDIINNLLFECQCALFLVDLNAPETMAPIQKLIQSRLNRWKTAFPFLKLIIVGTKMDLEKKTNVEDIQSLTALDPSIIKSIHISVTEPLNSIDMLAEMIYNAVTDPKNKIPLKIIRMSLDLSNKNLGNGYKLVLLGDSAVGKTAFMNRHFKNYFTEVFLSTIGIDDAFEAIKIGDEQLKLQIWDTAGQERFRCLPRKYYQNADGILLLFSFDIKESFENVTKWMNDIAQNSNRAMGRQNQQVDESNATTLFLLGNKCDLEERVVSRQEAEKKAQEYGMNYYEISCKSNINIDEVIANIILKCYSKSTGIKDCFSLSAKPKTTEAKKRKC